MFNEQLSQSPVIGAYSGLLAWMIPALELMICLSMTVPFSRKYGVQGFTITMAAFTVYIALLLSFSSDIPCICGGVIGGLSWPEHLIFNFVFLIWGTVLCLFFKKELHP